MLLKRILEEGHVKKAGMINSVNEEGIKCETIFPMIAGTDRNVVGLTCDKDGIPRNSEKKIFLLMFRSSLLFNQNGFYVFQQIRDHQIEIAAPEVVAVDHKSLFRQGLGAGHAGGVGPAASGQAGREQQAQSKCPNSVHTFA